MSPDRKLTRLAPIAIVFGVPTVPRILKTTSAWSSLQ